MQEDENNFATNGAYPNKFEGSRSGRTFSRPDATHNNLTKD